MEEKIFSVAGTFEKKGEKKFSKEVSAANEKFAVEKVLSSMGSKHRLKRDRIKISAVKEAGKAK
ncbi:MAG TPA: 50S ribosomal protein L18Ae [archaeon]|nr:50S ribosomal protein L18Ae [archaeon]